MQTKREKEREYAGKFLISTLSLFELFSCPVVASAALSPHSNVFFTIFTCFLYSLALYEIMKILHDYLLG